MDELKASEIAVGNCIILNDVEMPSGKLVAVITEMNSDSFYCKYLNADSQLSSYNKGKGMLIRLDGSLHRPTPVGRFGVRVLYDKTLRLYQCEKVGESSATYKDGKPRSWQEFQPYTYSPRSEVLKHCLPTSMQVDAVEH